MKAVSAKRPGTQLMMDYGQIILGSILGGAAFPLFLTPNHIAPGGITGVATILNYVSSGLLPVGITSLVLNVPLFLLGLKTMGRRFLIRTLFATILFSVLIDLIRVECVTHNEIMAAIFGGVMLGVGLALIFRGGATTGGTDTLARIVHQRITAITMGNFLIMFDGAVIFATMLTMKPERAMYAIICVFVSSKMIDYLLTGISTDKSCFIVSRKNDVIAKRIMNELSRGATLLNATGAYSGEAVAMLVCIVSRMEVMAVKKILNEEDPTAFLFIHDTHETIGEGFRSLSGND